MDLFVRKVALLVKDKAISIDEGTRLTNDYWKLRDSVTEINKKLEKTHKVEDREQRMELLKSLEEKSDQITKLEKTVSEELIPIMRKS